MLGLGGAFADQRLGAGARILQCRRQSGQHIGRRFAGLGQAFGFARERVGELRRAGGGIGHDQFQVTLGVAGDHFEFLGFAAQRVDRRFHAGALLRQRGFKRFAFVLQLLHQLVHLGAVFFLARQHEFGTAHHRVGNLLDARGMAFQHLGGFQRRFGRRGDGGAETGGLHVQRLGRHLQRAFGRFHHRLELRGAARHGFPGAAGGIGEIVAEAFQPLAFLVETGGDGVAAHLCAGARVIQRGNLFFQHRLQRAHALERDIQTGVQTIQFAAHGAGQPRSIVGGGFIGGEQPVAGGQHQRGGIGHGGAAGERGGDGDEEKGRQQNRGGDQRLGRQRLRQNLRAQPAPDKGASHAHPEQGQGGAGDQRQLGETAFLHARNRGGRRGLRVGRLNSPVERNRLPECPGHV